MQNQPIPFQYTLPIPMLNSLGSSFHVCFHNPPSAAVNKMVGKSASFLAEFSPGNSSSTMAHASTTASWRNSSDNTGFCASRDWSAAGSLEQQKKITEFNWTPKIYSMTPLTTNKSFTTIRRKNFAAQTPNPPVSFTFHIISCSIITWVTALIE